MCKYLLDLIGFNAAKPLMDYEDCKSKLNITIFSKPYIDEPGGTAQFAL